MKLSCFLSSALAVLLAPPAAAGPYTAAFYYGAQSPRNFYGYDWLITDPGNAPSLEGAPAGAKQLAYISFGETGRDEKGIGEKWVIGENKDWQTNAADLRAAGYQDHLLSRIKKLNGKYSGFFIDTLDSYQLALPAAEWSDYESKAAAFLDAVKAKYPDTLLVANRGFAIVDRTAKGTIDALAAESLFNGIDTKTMTYKVMPEADTLWLKNKLGEYTARGMPVIAIDYLPADKRGFARELAKKIRASGFIPFVTDISLSAYGISDLDPVSRELLFVAGADNDIYFSPLHQLLQMPAEHLGFDVKILQEKEIYKLNKSYRPHGVVVWLEASLAKEPARFLAWIKERIGDGTKVVFVNSFGFEPDKDILRELGLSAEDNAAGYADPVAILAKDPIADFETKTRVDHDSLLVTTNAAPLLTAQNSRGQTFVPAAVTPWGGYALYYSLTREINGENLWELNPFEFLKKTLRLPDLPVPDMTTENGRRIFFSHVDGDGFIEPGDWGNKKNAAEELQDTVFSRYDLPFSVSVIEGEISGHGAYPENSEKYEETARSIYRLPNIEAASHSFSHPFYWGIKTDVSLYKDHNLPIKDYVFDPVREIAGSRDYINTLLPEGKTVKMFFWTGNCLPGETQIQLTKDAGLLNLNGAGASITNSFPWLSRVMPAFIARHEAVQVYAPVVNDNIYTDGWRFPFYRFIQALETIKQTGAPRRLKPAGVYFHFFSGTRIASLTALKRVLDAAQEMKLTPLFASEYVLRALDFKTTYAARTADGGWVMKNNGNLRTLRAENSYGEPDLPRSKGLAGFKKEKDSTYIHLDGSGDYRIYFSSRAAAIPYIEEASAIIDGFTRDSRGFKAVLTARGRGEVVISNAAGCRLALNGKLSGNPVKLAKSGDYEIACECK